VLARDFLWHRMAPRSRYGGMILGINLLTYDIGEIEEGDFFIHFKVHHKEDDFKFNLISIYGPAQNDLKSNFLSEVVRVCSKDTCPIQGRPGKIRDPVRNTKWTPNI